MKRQEQRAVKKKLVTRSLIWLMSPGRINCSTETSLGRGASISGFLHSQRLQRAKDGTSSVSTSLWGL